MGHTVSHKTQALTRTHTQRERDVARTYTSIGATETSESINSQYVRGCRYNRERASGRARTRLYAF